MVNIKAISVNVGKALLVSALFMALSLVVSLICGRDTGFSPLLISFVITLIVGAFPFIFVRKVPSMSMKEGYVTIIRAWLLSFIFGMLPYVLWGGEFTLVNAWFESIEKGHARRPQSQAGTYRQDKIYRSDDPHHLCGFILIALF